MALLALIIVCTISIVFADYNVTNYNEPILKEHYGTTYLYSEEWTTLHFIDMNEVNIEFLNLDTHLKNLIMQCTNLQCNSKEALEALKNRMDGLSERLKTISMMSKNRLYKRSPLITSNGNRHKRGLFDVVGKGLNFLFGSMDADDAKHIANTLDNIYDHSSNAILLVKKQTTIVKNLLVKINQYEEKRNNDITLLSNLTNQIEDAVNVNKYNSIVLENLLSTLINFNFFEQIVNTIENSIQSDHTNLIPPLLITPKNFINSLYKIYEDSGKNMLLKPTVENYHLFIKLTKVDLMIHDNKIIFRLVTPIPNTIEYNIIKITPVPVSA